ncbi:MAG: c-type cytochrome [Bacteroidota bacterium]
MIDYAEDPLREFSEGRKLFNIECAMCHRIGAKNTPDFLHSLDLKLNKDYFHLYLTQQDSLLESNDLYASRAKKKLDIINLASNHNYDFTSAETEKIYAFILAAYNK